MWNANHVPSSVAISGVAFKEGEIDGCGKGEINNQFSKAPPKIAPRVKNIKGIVRLRVSSDDWDKGGAFRSFHKRLIEKRRE